MTKKIVSVAIVLLFTCLVVYAGAFANNQSDLENEQKVEEGTEALASDANEPPNLEAVLKEAKEDGYTVRKATRYDAYDTIKDMHIVLYSEEQEIKSFDFDVMCNQIGYGLIKRDADGRIILDIEYDSDNQVSHKTAYEYDGPILLKEEMYLVEDGTHYCSGVTEYEYDEEGRRVKWAEYEEDYYSGGTEYEYDETGRMIKLAQFRGDHKLLQYWTYEYFD